MKGKNDEEKKIHLLNIYKGSQRRQMAKKDTEEKIVDFPRNLNSSHRLQK